MQGRLQPNGLRGTRLRHTHPHSPLGVSGALEVASTCVALHHGEAIKAPEESHPRREYTNHLATIAGIRSASSEPYQDLLISYDVILRTALSMGYFQGSLLELVSPRRPPRSTAQRSTVETPHPRCACLRNSFMDMH